MPHLYEKNDLFKILETIKDVPNINKESYNYFMKIQLENDPDLKKEIENYVLDKEINESNYMLKLPKIVEEDKEDVWAYIDNRRRELAIQTGGGIKGSSRNLDYKHKYIKYKSKYLKYKK